ncbi:3-oxo-Delta(4,5)-steroid 5-beta-reductase [Trifolium pratense]|uniref:3-oxo-Delta(4,5)-steroid 5-beta-reductase n=1 Tax=Trifolium pratense TaxID=57577 RepID=UPI001E696AD9|nr:3-oxo-Delta(4,5)-steroid 5-beta-reductase [Trifolium pratense]
MAATKEKKSVAIIFGVTGLVGRELAKKLLLESSWKVYGIARNQDTLPNTLLSPSYNFISCDLLNPLETQKKLSSLQDVTHVFWVTWASQFPLDTQESCDQNKAMMSNALDSLLSNAKNLKHVSLQTGTKHYVSLQAPFDEQKKLYYYKEEFPRMSSGTNFYYALEDLLIEKLNGKVYWSVHRPGLLFGNSIRSFYNFMGSLCVYGSICKKLKIPFVFGGTKECWEEPYIDGSDARLVADQHIWAATKSSIVSTNGQAFNSINGPSFTWKEIWPIVGKKLGVQVPQEMVVGNFLYSKAMFEKQQVWEEIVEENGLVKTKVENLANWEFLDALFRFPFKLMGSRDKVEEFGFGARYKTLNSILYWIDCMRDEKVIP